MAIKANVNENFESCQLQKLKKKKNSKSESQSQYLEQKLQHDVVRFETTCYNCSF